MKTLLTIFTLVFTLMFSSTSFAEWFEMEKSVYGDTYYLDLDTIRLVDGYVYYWSLTDNVKPDEYGSLSKIAYHQGDCEIFRMKILSLTPHQQPMGRGVGESYSFKNPDWFYPKPESVGHDILRGVCYTQGFR